MKADFPELLAPAGSPAALDAALEAGADAVYLGGPAFNARMNAKNFTREDLQAGIRRAHALGTAVYMTLNTQVYDRELPALLDAARAAYDDGVDALIIADHGAARCIHRILPEFPLHASTQTSGHSTEMGRLLSEFGYTRMVLARETPADCIRTFCENSPIEAEIFLHGALCVSHSGQCLFSSVVGGRSGNRGECAQPCRLPYNGSYPLSLKDLCLARQIPELIGMGVASLKIEGRMKSPEYVGAVTKIYRTLLDERRAATPDEIARLSEIFSRGGFTDGYYRKKIGAEMLGIRSESDKEASRTLDPFRGLTKKAPITLDFTAKSGLPITLTASKNGTSVTVTGEIPPTAETTPTGADTVREKLTKLGGTVYAAESVTVDLDEGLLIPVGWINALRRDAVAALEHLDALPLAGKRADPTDTAVPPLPKRTATPARRTARFLSPAQITKTAASYFDVRYLPLHTFLASDSDANGVILPPVVFDSDCGAVTDALAEAVRRGIRHVLVTNPAQLATVSAAAEEIRESDTPISVTADFRIAVTNRASAAFLGDLSPRIASYVLSPELTLPQMRDLSGDREVVVYGRIPLMLLEKCVNVGKNGKKTGDKCLACRKCHEGCDNADAFLPSAVLTDRRKVSFPVLREWEHRNVVYNSVPTYLGDRLGDLTRAGLQAHHYIFSVESPSEVERVIAAFRTGAPPSGQVRRLPT